MGRIFALDEDTKSVIRDALDDLLENTSVGGLGKSCLIVYPSRFVACDNCILDPIGRKSANRPRTGAPIPFSVGQTCPMCSGQGQKAIESSETLTLKCNWEVRNFKKPLANVDVRIPYSLVEVKGYMKDLPKLLKADHIIVNVPIAPYLRQKFRLLGEPGDPSNIIQGRYFVALYERWNG